MQTDPQRDRLSPLQAAALFVGLAALLLAALGAREKDYYRTCSDDVRYADGYEAAADKSAFWGQPIAEGYELNNLYPGSYQLSIEYESTDAANFFEVLDMADWEVLARGTYDPAQNKVTVHFEVPRRIQFVVVRSTLQGGELLLGDCEVSSAAPVYSDTWWGLALLALCLAALWAAVKGARAGRPHALILLAASLTLSLPMLTDHLQRGHDISFHLTRIDGIASALLGGQFPVRLCPDFLYGGGYISPIMYPELFLYLPGVMCATGASVLFAFKVFCSLIQMATAFIGYYGMKPLLGERKGLYFALFYLLNPYRMGNIYVRAAIGEALAMAFLPLAAAGLWQLFQGEPQKGFFSACLGITGVFQSHLITTLMLLFFGGAYGLWYIFTHFRSFFSQRGRIFALLGAAGATLALNAWLILPFLTYSRWDLNIFRERPDVGSASVYLYQAFVDYYTTGQENGNSTTQGEIVTTLGPAVLLGLLLFLFCLVRPRREQEDEQLRTVGAAAFVMGCMALFMVSNLFPWQVLQRIDWLSGIISTVQFAWRFLIVSSLMFSLVLAVLFRQLQTDRAQVCMAVLAVLSLSGACLITTGYLYQNPCEMEDKCGNWDHNSVYGGQYLLDDTDLAALCNRLREGSVYALDAGCVLQWHRENVQVDFTFEKPLDAQATFQAPLYYYGLHRAYLDDGTLLSLQAGDTGLVHVTVPAGVQQGSVHIVYASPRRFRLAEGVSAAALLGLFALWAYGRRRVASGLPAPAPT